MKTKRYYCTEYDENLYNILVKNNIKVKISEYNNIRKETWMSFTVYENGQGWDEYEPLLPTKINLIDYEYTEKEMNESKWFYVRSRCMKLDNYNENTFEYSCIKEYEVDGEKIRVAYHELQVEPFAFKPIKWNDRNHIYSAYEGSYHIMFCDDVVKELMINNNVNGIKFDKVLWAKKNIELPNANQITTDNIIPDEALVIEGFEKGYVSIKKCPICGRITYLPNNGFILGAKKDYLDEKVDIYRTNYLFGMARGLPRYVISKKVYKLLKDAKMTRNLEIRPLILK